MKFDHPAFVPYRALIDVLDLARAPALPRPACLDALNAQAEHLDSHNAHGLPLRFSTPDGRLSARDYETHILQTGQVPTRVETWHDVLNALVWLRFPRFKSALNAAHVSAIANEAGPGRGRRRDALTMLDESGIWVISHDPAWPALLAGRAWQSLFWEHRHAVDTAMKFIVVGHALLEKLRDPYPGITGKCLMLTAESLDPDAAEGLSIQALGSIDSPHLLAPLPVQGIPGWDPDSENAAYYANQAIFRPVRNVSS